MGIQKIAFFGKYDTEDTFEVSVATETEEFGELAREFAGFAVAMGYDPETVSEFVKVDDDVVAECCGDCDEPIDAATYAVKATEPQVYFTKDEYRLIRDLISNTGPGTQAPSVVHAIREKLNDAGYEFQGTHHYMSGSIYLK